MGLGRAGRSRNGGAEHEKEEVTVADVGEVEVAVEVEDVEKKKMME